MRKILLKDRSLHDASIKALTSTVRSYSKHEQVYLFRTYELDIPGLATSFGLLRMPKMPELKGKEIDEKDWQDAEVDVSCTLLSLKTNLFNSSGTLTLTLMHHKKHPVRKNSKKHQNVKSNQRRRRKQPGRTRKIDTINV